MTAGLRQARPQLSGEDARIGAPARVDGEGTIDGADEAASVGRDVRVAREGAPDAIWRAVSAGEAVKKGW